jgi:hypothetical protein
MSDTNNTNPFLTATRKKLRFPSNNGHLSTEDLWDLPLKDLDKLAVAADGNLGVGRKTFLENPGDVPNPTQEENELRLATILAVIGVKQEENKAKKEAADKKAQLAFLTELKKKRELADLESLSAEEIDKQIAALAAS